MTILLVKEAPTLNRLFKMAIVTGVEGSVRLHIDRGDDLNARDEKGLTPLMLAAHRNKASICRLLLDAGADPESLDPVGRNALAIALVSGSLVKALPRGFQPVGKVLAHALGAQGRVAPQ